MKLFSRLAVGLALVAVAVGPAYAADLGGPREDSARPALARAAGWSGLHVGVHGGMDLTNTEIGVPGASIDGAGHAGFGYGVHAGYDHQLKGSPIVVGIGADYTWSDADFAISSGGVTMFRAGIDKSWSVTGRLGLDMGRAMPYILGGFARADASADVGGVSIGSISMDGWIAGGGVELRVSDNVFLGAEYRYTRFDAPTLGGGLTLDPERHEVRAALKYRVNLFGQ
jgi:outer membrane immunogenic protein